MLIQSPLQYWNFGGSSGVPEDYSYVYQAAEQGL